MRTNQHKVESTKIATIETFANIDHWLQSHMIQSDPSCFNSMVRFRKTRITIEPIDEPKEVLAERLQKLWDESDNSHDWTPLRGAAKSIGYDFLNSPGTKRKRK